MWKTEQPTCNKKDSQKSQSLWFQRGTEIPPAMPRCLVDRSFRRVLIGLVGGPLRHRVLPPLHAFDFIRLEQGARLILVRDPFGMNLLTGSAWIYPSCRCAEQDNNGGLDCGLSLCCLRQPCPLSYTQRKRE